MNNYIVEQNLSWQAKLLKILLKLLVKPYFTKFSREKSPDNLMKMIFTARKIIKYSNFFKKLPADINIQAILINQISARWISHQALSTSKVILYFHGGGYMFGSAQSYTKFVCFLSKACNAKVLLIDYRLVPEHSLDCALIDAFESYNYLINILKISPDNIITAGDSAGGGLALSLIAKLKDDHLPLPKAVVCISPWTDLLLTGDSHATNRQSDSYIVVPEKLSLFDHVDLSHPYISPLYADLRGFPPVYIQVSRSEVLLDDAFRFAKKAEHANVLITLEMWKNLPHCWQLFIRFLPAARQALKNIAQFIHLL